MICTRTHYCSVDQIEKKELGAYSTHGGKRGANKVFIGTPEGKRPLGRPRHRWDDNIKMDLQEVVCGSMDWIKLALDRDKLAGHL